MAEIVDLIVLFAILGAMIIAAILAAELRNLTYSVASFAIMGLMGGFLFMYLNSPYIAAVQVLVYAGVISVLVLAVISLTRGEEDEEEQQETSTS